MVGADLVAALVSSATGDAKALVRLLKAHSLAPAGVDEIVREQRPDLVADEKWSAAVAANEAKADRLARAAALAERALAPLAARAALPNSALGPRWSSDVDVLVAPPDLAEAEGLLRDAGLLDLNPLLERIGRVTPDVRRYGAVEGTEVLGSVELCLHLTDGGPPAGPALGRARAPEPGRIGRLDPADDARRRAVKLSAARRVPLRGALELLALDAAVLDLPREPVMAVALERCAELERELTGAGRLTELAAAREAPRNLEWARARGRGVQREVALRARPRRLVVAFSGIDGSGKSTQAETLEENLLRMSIPATAVWARLGFGGSKALERAAALAQRVLPRGAHSAQEARATGEASPESDHVPLTRRGPVGWTWAMSVTLDYVRRLRGPLRRARGAVVVLDRALPDALIGLDEGYGGALDLTTHRRIVERHGPRADITFFLRLSGAASFARKADLFSAEVLEDHARRYEALLPTLPGVVVLDAEMPPDELAMAALRAFLTVAR